VKRRSREGSIKVSMLAQAWGANGTAAAGWEGKGAGITIGTGRMGICRRHLGRVVLRTCVGLRWGREPCGNKTHTSAGEAVGALWSAGIAAVAAAGQ